MDGWVISDGSSGGDESGDSGTTTITSFTLGAGEYAVFAGFDIPAAHGGVQFDYFYTYRTPSFNNESSYTNDTMTNSNCPDGVVLFKGTGELVDQVLYDYGYGEYIEFGTSNRCSNSTAANGFPIQGANSRLSMQLTNDPAVMNSNDNDDAANWSLSTVEYGVDSDQFGSPGAANE